MRLYSRTFATPSQPKQFRRKERVTKITTQRRTTNGVSTQQQETWHGTVLNPENYIYTNGSRLVTVRWDHQHSWEKGYGEQETNLTTDSSGITQFDTRRYDLRHLSHDEIGIMRAALVDFNRSDAADLLKKLPELPS